MRAAQDLDLIHVQQGDVVGDLASDVDFIDIGRDRHIECSDLFGGSETSDEVADGTPRAGVQTPRQAWRNPHEVGRILYDSDFQLGVSEGRNGYRHVLDVLLPALGSDDDFIDARDGPVGRPILGSCRKCDKHGGGGGGGEKRNGKTHGRNSRFAMWARTSARFYWYILISFGAADKRGYPVCGLEAHTCDD